MTPPQTPFDYDLGKLPTKMKGIDPRVVQLILEEGREEWRKMELKLADLGDKIEQYEVERSSVNNALIGAQKSADDVMREAQLKAEQLIEEAQSKTMHVVDEHRVALRDLQEDLERMTLTKQKFADDFRALLRGYLSELDARFPMSIVNKSEDKPAAFQPPVESIEPSQEPIGESTEMSEHVAD
jgi:cell division septum initiation protein DivIVA